jgi:hypothetical protein
VSKADELRAELALAELEEELAAAKADGTLDRELKNKVRDARAAHREAREV